MNQKLSDWANVAQIVSSIAVVVTLLFLLVGIRDNTEITRAATYADLMGGLNDYSMAIAGNPDLSRLWLAFMTMETDKLDESDIPRLTQIIQTQFRNYESAWYSLQYGVIGDAEWERVDRLLCLGWERARSANANIRIGSVEAILTTPFVDYIESSCSDAG